MMTNITIIRSQPLPDLLFGPTADEFVRQVEESFVLTLAPDDGLTWLEREALAWERMNQAANEMEVAMS